MSLWFIVGVIVAVVVVIVVLAVVIVICCRKDHHHGGVFKTRRTSLTLGVNGGNWRQDPSAFTLNTEPYTVGVFVLTLKLKKNKAHVKMFFESLVVYTLSLCRDVFQQSCFYGL